MSPRRLTLTIAACLFLGFLLNFAIAAICGWQTNIPRTSHGIIYYVPLNGSYQQYQLAWWGDFGRESISYNRLQADQPDRPPTLAEFREAFSAATSPALNPGSSISKAQWDIEAACFFQTQAEWATFSTQADPARKVYLTGFPLRSFRGRTTQATMFGPFTQTSGFLVVYPNHMVRAIPVRPILLGTVVNSGIYAAPILILSLLPSLRRSLRTRRGHCPRCNYDLLANFPSGCPECGWNRASKPLPTTAS